MNTRTIALSGLMLLLLIGGGYWFSVNFELRTESVETGFSGRARINDFLAAQRFLERSGMAVRAVPGVFDLDQRLGQHDVVVLPLRHGSVDLQRAADLYGWIDGGGHLIVAVPEDEILPSVQAQNIQEWLHIKRVSRTDERADGPVRLPVPGFSRPLEVSFDADYHLQSGEYTAWTLAEDDYAYVARVHIGDGRVTLLSDDGFMRNGSIAEGDNAAFLRHLVMPREDDAQVWLIYSDNAPSLLSWLWGHAWAVLAPLGLLLLAWLYRGTRRFGGRIPEPETARRSLREHILASGRLLWRHRQGAHLLQAARQALRARTETLHPAWAYLEGEALYQRYASVCALPAEQVRFAFELRDTDDEQTFLSALRTLETLRNKL